MFKKTLRPATAMIELIFALVIIGIVLTSAPQLIQVAAKSGYVAIQQEAINEAASQSNMIMGYYWDESNTNEEYTPSILKVSSGDTELNEVNTTGKPGTGRRLGTPDESYRTFIRADGQRLSASDIVGNTAKNDIGDFNGDNTAANISTRVSYISDTANYTAPIGGVMTFDPDFVSSGETASTASTNIKRITVKLTSTNTSELNKSIVLHAFRCNIGGYTLEMKDFQ